MFRDFFRFLRWNLQHYFFAVWGLELKFDPPYPHVTRFFYPYIEQPVFEYRTYGLHAVWAILLAAVLPAPLLTAAVVLWAVQSFHRSHYLRNNLVFWRKVLQENGPRHTRAHGRYMEALIREMERAIKAGESWELLAREAAKLQDEVIRQAGSKDAARRILAG